MSKNLEKTYNPKEIEAKLYEKWCEEKYFHAEVDRSKKPFTTVMPPPNITGKLHMGHALDNTLQDILIRYKRMQGYNALWIPGTDHAAISTEVKVTNQLKAEGIDKKELGREGFLKRTWQWKEEYAGTIEGQLKKLGVSCDWDRERFTMDEGCSNAVKEVFLRLHEKGFIYKGSRIINWCPVCKTSLSDAEVEHEEQAGHFWHIKYPIVGTERFLEIATTRPETLLGDTAIAVHPDDDRYKDIVGKNVILAETSDHGNRIHNAGTCRPGKKIALITKLSGGFHDAFPCFRAQTLRLGVIPQCQGNRRLVDLRRFCNVFDRNRHVLTLIQHSVKRFRSSILIINRFLILSRGEKTGKSFFSGKIGKTSAEMEFLPFFFESRLVFLPLSWYFP